MKYTLPGPMTMVDTLYDAHYRSREKLAWAFAEILNDEARAIDAATRAAWFAALFPVAYVILTRAVIYDGIRVGPGRGSAAGAMIAYALGITELDPMKHGLLFERFLNPERVSMPDIDMDFDERRRGDMIRYATETYCEERVAQIITYGSIKAKAAVKDSARVLGYPYALGDRITKAMPPSVMGKDISLAGAFDPKNSRYGEAAEFRALYDSDPDAKRVVDTAKGLEGLKRQPGVHAAGVILCSEPLLDVIPIWRRDQDGAIITQFDMGVCETLGLLKMDFLGLRNLTVLDDCLRNIASNRGETIVLEDLTLDDPATYELLTRGDTLGVFQLDGGPMRALRRSMVPDNFEDISAVLALAAGVLVYPLHRHLELGQIDLIVLAGRCRVVAFHRWVANETYFDDDWLSPPSEPGSAVRLGRAVSRQSGDNASGRHQRSCEQHRADRDPALQVQ